MVLVDTHGHGIIAVQDAGQEAFENVEEVLTPFAMAQHDLRVLNVF